MDIFWDQQDFVVVVVVRILLLLLLLNNRVAVLFEVNDILAIQWNPLKRPDMRTPLYKGYHAESQKLQN